MSDDRDHEEKARRTAHDIVEELREEIHEVVEHVPKPVRWTVGKITRVVSLAVAGFVVLVLITAILFLANRTEWVAQEVSLLINQSLALRSDVVLEVQDLKGNPLNRVRVIEPRVRFRGDDGPSLLEASSMTITYSPWKFITGRRGMVIELDSPVIRIVRRDDGMLRLPEWRSGKASTAVTTFDVRLKVANGVVVLPDDQRVKGLTFDTSLHTGRPTRVVLHDLAWEDAPMFGALESARGTLSAADSIRFELAELRAPDLDMHAFGAWEAGPGDEVKERHMHVRVDRVKWTWLAKVFRNTNFDVPGEGAAVAEVFRDVAGRFHGSFMSEVEWNGLRGHGNGDFAYADGRIELEPLEAFSPAGNLRGRFEMDGKPWTLTGTVRSGDPQQWTAFGLEGWPQGDLNGTARYHVAANGAAEIDAILGPSSIAGWNADSASVRIQTWRTASDSFHISFHRRNGDARLVASADDAGWQGLYGVRRFPLDEWPDGRATGLTGMIERGEGTVRGRDGSLFVTGTLEGADADWFGAHADRWRLDAVDGQLLPAPDLQARAQLGDLLFLGVHFDSLTSPARLGDGALGFDSLVAAAGDTVLRMDGQARWDDTRWTLEASRVRMTSSQFDWTADPPMQLSGTPRGVRFDRLAAVDGGAHLRIEGDWAAAGGVYDWRLTGESLDISRLGLEPALALEGRADVDLTVRGPGGDPRWRFDAWASQPGTRGARMDSVWIGMEGSAHRLDVDRFVALSDAGRATGTLRFDGMVQAWPDSTTPAAVARWLATAASWAGGGEAEAFPVNGWGTLVRGADDFGGRLTGTMRLQGRPAEPELETAFTAKPLSWRDYTLDDVQVRARYADRRLDVPEVKMTREGLASTASGTLPLKLVLGSPPETTDEPMSWRMDIPRGDLAVLPLFVPQIGAARGTFALAATVEGTVSDHRLDGRLTVRDGQLRLTGREEVLRDLTADFRFDETTVHLDTLIAYQGRQGVVRGGGVVQLDQFKLGGYRFNLDVRDFTALESGLYRATFDGRFNVTDGVQVHGQTLPHVVGTIEMLDAGILLDFASESEMQQFTSNAQPLIWTYRVNLRAANKLRWQPSNADVEFSADLVLEQSPDSLSIFGDMDALRGRYYFLSNRFDVIRADLTFDDVSGLDPQLDIEAETRLTPTTIASSSEDRPVPEEIQVRITGRARTPVIEFSSTSDWDQPTILRELTIGRVDLTDARAAFGDPLDDFVTRAINRQLSVEMSKVFQGYVNEWALRRESGGLFSGEGDLYAEVGIPLSAQWQIRYRQRVPGLEQGGSPVYAAGTGPFERDLEVEYRLNRFFYVTSEVLQRRTSTGTTTNSTEGAEFNVNLKARWEY